VGRQCLRPTKCMLMKEQTTSNLVVHNRLLKC
jgi:hypothetical protein